MTPSPPARSPWHLRVLLLALLPGCGPWPDYLKPGYEEDSGWHGGTDSVPWDGWDETWDTWAPDEEDPYLDVFGMTFTTATCVVDGSPATCTWEGSEMPNEFNITLFDLEYLETWSTDGVCGMSLTGDRLPGTLAAPALYDWSLANVEVETDCLLDPAQWGDPQDLFSGIAWEYTIEMADDATQDLLEDYGVFDPTTTLSGRLFWDGVNATGLDTQAFWTQGYAVEGGVEVDMSRLITVAEVQDGADAYFVQSALYYWTL